jgi:hypothetical protein
MISKVRSLFTSISKVPSRLFSKKVNEAPPKSNAKMEFIEKDKFTNDILILYQSKETLSSKLISLGMLGFGLFDAYLYYQKDEDFRESAEAFTAVSIFIFLGIFEWKLRKTPRSIWLEKDGGTAIVEFYKFWGFSTNAIELDTKDFRGFGPYLPKFNSVPIARYTLDSKKKYFFFKTSSIQNQDLLKKLFSGYTFKVGESDLNVNLSKKAKSTYHI